MTKIIAGDTVFIINDNTFIQSIVMETSIQDIQVKYKGNKYFFTILF